MGYTTEFSGEFTITPQLKPEHRAYLQAFADIRHVQRNPAALAVLPDPLREAVGLPIGDEGEFYIGDGRQSFAEEDRIGVRDWNKEPSGIPSMYLQWRPDELGDVLSWDGGEKFYEYIPWLKFLIEKFLKPWDYRLEGSVEWNGEESDDRGMIVVNDNKVRVRYMLADPYGDEMDP